MIIINLLPVWAGALIGITCGILSVLCFFYYTWHKSFSYWLYKTGLQTWNTLKKISMRDYFESNLRASTGKPLERPFGTTNHYFNWNQIRFNPVYYTHQPVSESIKIGTDITIGTNALRPLHLKIPIMIGGMSYGGALSLKTKIALAKGATLSGTAANSGNGPFLLEERVNATRYILQYSRGFWAKVEEYLQQADMIEINLGQGAWGPAPVRINGKVINPEFAKRLGTIPGLDVLIEARLPEVESQRDWKHLIQRLKSVSGGVPIAVKLGSTHYLERELDLVLAGGVDAIVVDGAEGGTHACPPILLDDIGLPLFPSICRAVNYLKVQNLFGSVSLIVGGGLSTPGSFSKCLALGADAVIIGTIAALTMVHTQIGKTVPWEPPTTLIYHGGKHEAIYDPDLGAKHFSNFLLGSIAEMQQLARCLGKKHIREINQQDLVAIDPLYAVIAQIDY